MAPKPPEKTYVVEATVVSLTPALSRWEREKKERVRPDFHGGPYAADAPWAG
jgi:hypothetical protein